jgi:predicted nucleotidyltransferase
MVEIERIREFSNRIAREFRPERIVLFGSYACGTAREDSDVDLLVILPFDGTPAKKSVEILSRVSPTFPVDLVVRTPQQVRQRLEWNDWFLREVMEQGVTLYAAPDW